MHVASGDGCVFVPEQELDLPDVQAPPDPAAGSPMAQRMQAVVFVQQICIPQPALPCALEASCAKPPQVPVDEESVGLALRSGLQMSN